MGVPGVLQNWPCVDIATLVSHRSGQNFPMDEENELLFLSGLVQFLLGLCTDPFAQGQTPGTMRSGYRSSIREG
jgi:hypothetical protein